MIIGHLPGGFLITYSALRKHRQAPYYLILLLAGMVASIVPDLDLFYHHLVDHRQHGHHSYWTHIPIYWLGIYLSFLLPARVLNAKRVELLLHVVFLALMSHMLLDSITSGIKWLYPFNNGYHGLWRLWIVPARYDWWVMNYLLHWIFIYELALLTTSLFILVRDKALVFSMYELILRFLPKRFIPKRETTR